MAYQPGVAIFAEHPLQAAANLPGQRLQQGIPLPAAVWKQLAALATQVRVALPE